MKKVLFIVLSVVSVHCAKAQSVQWSMTWDDKTRWPFIGNTGDDTAVLTAKKLAKGKDIFFDYQPATDESEWIRKLMINDSTGSGVIGLPEIKMIEKGKRRVRYAIPGKKFKEILTKYKKISVWYSSIPSDPARAALVRVRPVQICTIILR